MGRKGGGQPDSCRGCGTLLEGEDPDPLRDRVIEIKAAVIELLGSA